MRDTNLTFMKHDDERLFSNYLMIIIWIKFGVNTGSIRVVIIYY